MIDCWQSVGRGEVDSQGLTDLAPTRHYDTITSTTHCKYKEQFYYTH
jgi:hypothetical protein